MDSSVKGFRRPAGPQGVEMVGVSGSWLQRARQWMVPCVAVMVAFVGLESTAQAETLTRVYQSRMADGSVAFGDKPVAGAREYSSREYRLPDPLPDDVLEAERLEWEHQARAFDHRHAERQAIQAAEASARRPRRDAVWQSRAGSPFSESGTYVHGSAPVASWGPQARPVAPPPAGYASQYRSSPGAVNGRQNPALGSGFVAHPPRY
ncbi:MAG: hypothetical protein Q4D91_01255 [Lautropia sp.]|nr:hypothetical protein [Lautropia sp.]